MEPSQASSDDSQNGTNFSGLPVPATPAPPAQLTRISILPKLWMQVSMIILGGVEVRNRIVAGYSRSSQFSELLDNLVRRAMVQTDCISASANIIHHHLSALADHAQANLPAYSAPTAGYDSALSFQPFGHHCSPRQINSRSESVDLYDRCHRHIGDSLVFGRII